MTVQMRNLRLIGCVALLAGVGAVAWGLADSATSQAPPKTPTREIAASGQVFSVPESVRESGLAIDRASVVAETDYATYLAGPGTEKDTRCFAEVPRIDGDVVVGCDSTAVLSAKAGWLVFHPNEDKTEKSGVLLLAPGRDYRSAQAGDTVLAVKGLAVPFTLSAAAPRIDVTSEEGIHTFEFPSDLGR